MTTEIVHVEPQIEDLTISPASFQQAVDDAAEKAKTLARIVESQHLYAQIRQDKHLKVEAWETIAKGYGCSAAVQQDEILYDPNGIEIGAKAYAVVYDQNGVIRGGAWGYCMKDEQRWNSAPTFQRISMAGTRAVSKSLRLMFSWVVVLAGYSPTPAEEMIQEARGASERTVQRPPVPPAPKPQRKAPRSSPEKLEQLDRARYEAGPDGEQVEVVSVDKLNNYVASTFEERDIRDLTTEEIDRVIDAVLAGLVR